MDVDDINNVVLWVQCSKFYEQVKVVDDMNDSGSHALRPLDVMNSLGLWKDEWFQVMSPMNNLRLWMTWTTLGHELNALNVLNNSRLWLTWMNLGHELRTPDAMNNSETWMTWTTPCGELRALDAMKSSKLWMIWTTRIPMSLGLYMLWIS